MRDKPFVYRDRLIWQWRCQPCAITGVGLRWTQRDAFDSALRHVCTPVRPRRTRPCTHLDTWFSRTLCAEPCGSMHDHCTECGIVVGYCPHGRCTEGDRS